MKLPRRQFLHLAVGAVALSAVSHGARAQAYPTRPLRDFIYHGEEEDADRYDVPQNNRNTCIGRSRAATSRAVSSSLRPNQGII